MYNSMNSSSTIITLNKISRWLNYVFAIPIVVGGTIGSIFIIIIFLAKSTFRRNSTINYLLAGAILTAIHLPTVYLQGILVDGFGLGVYNTNDIACREHHYLFYMTTVATISFPCWAAFDQYASTSNDAAFRKRWSSVRVSRFVIICTIVFWSIIYIPIIFISNSVNDVCILIDNPLTKINNYLLTPLAYTILPLILIISFTRGTIENLRRNRMNKRRNRFATQIHRMLIPQLFILGLSGIPFGIFNIYLDLTNQTGKTALIVSTDNLILQIVRLFYHLNFVLTFYIYLCMSNVVRKTFKRIIFCYNHNNQVTPSLVPIENSISLREIHQQQ